MLRALVDSLAGFAVPTNHEVREGRGLRLTLPLKPSKLNPGIAPFLGLDFLTHSQSVIIANYFKSYINATVNAIDCSRQLARWHPL
jgi:hypothetical protein